MMTSSSLLILLSLCTCIFSNSLSGFNEVAGNDISYVDLVKEIENNLVVHEAKKLPYSTVFDGSVESCAEQCSNVQFYCHSFMVVWSKGKELDKCIMTDKPLSNVHTYFEEGDRILEAAYECIPHFQIHGLCSRRNIKIDNVATILNNPTLLSEERFREFLAGYGAIEEFVGQEQVGNLMTFVEGCRAALDVPESEPTNFKKWLNGEESSYEQSTSGSTPKYNSNYKPSKKRRKIISNLPGLHILAFLDLFSRGVDSRTQTIYDDQGTLYIDSPDIQLLIIVYENGDYIYAVSGNKLWTNKVQVGGSQARTSGDGLNTAVTDFVNAAGRFGHKVEYEISISPTEDKFDDYKIPKFASFLINEEFVHYTKSNHLLLYRDLSDVVRITHQRRASQDSPFTEQGRTSLPYKDVRFMK